MRPGNEARIGGEFLLARTSISAGRCGTPIRRATFSGDMVLNDDMMMRPWRGSRARFFSCRLMGRSLPHTQIITRPGRLPVNRLSLSDLVVLVAMMKVGVVRMPVPKPSCRCQWVCGSIAVPSWMC